MSGGIKESDWKVFKQVHAAAYERFCERIVSEVRRIAEDEAKEAQDRFAAIDELLRRRKKELGNAFGDFRRSTAFFQLGAMYAHGLLRDQELSQFSPEMQEALKRLCDSGRPS